MILVKMLLIFIVLEIGYYFFSTYSSGLKYERSNTVTVFNFVGSLMIAVVWG